jgi:hypothetical protein
VVGFDVPCPCVTVEQHTHKHRTANYGTIGTPPTHILSAQEAPSTTISNKMVVMSPATPRRSPDHLPPRTCTGARKSRRWVLPALRHHPRLSRPQRLVRCRWRLRRILQRRPWNGEMHPHGELSYAEVDESDRAVWLSMDAVLDVVRGRVTNGFRARRCLASRCVDPAPAVIATACEIEGCSPMAHIDANCSPTSDPHHRLRRAAAIDA